MKTFLAIDVGTSSSKLSLYDSHGRLLYARSAHYPVDYPRPEWAEQDPAVWWEALCRLGPEVMAATTARSLAGISVSGQTPLCAPIDEHGQALRPALLWSDRRASPQVAWLQEQIGEARCRERSPNRLDSYFGGAKWLWYRQNEPENFQRTWKILQANSYIIYRLTGQTVIDPSQAGLCSPCFDFHTQQWDEEICQRMGIPLEMLPEIHPSARVVGTVRPEAALAAGLPAGVPVVCGGGDFACACLGAAVQPGSAALMLGTAGNLLFPGRVNDDPRLLHTIHLTGEPLPFGGVLAGGNLTWFARLVGFGGDEAGLFQRLDEEAARIEPGCEGLVFLPYLMGERTPIWDPEARGAFIGLSSRHTRAHLYRAILEGVAFAFRQIYDIVQENGCDGSPGASDIRALTAIDGGARSPLWRLILASAIGVPVVEGSLRSGTGLGSAFLAAIGSKGAEFAGKIDHWVETGAVTDPQVALQRRYEVVYPVYTGLYEKLKADFHSLA